MCKPIRGSLRCSIGKCSGPICEERVRQSGVSRRCVGLYLVEFGEGRVEVAEVHERALAARHVRRAPDQRAVRLPLLHLRAHCAASAVQRVLRAGEET